MREILRSRNLWSRLGWFLLGTLVVVGSKDLFERGLGTGNGEFLGHFSTKWGVGLIGYSLIALCALGFVVYGVVKPSGLETRFISHVERYMKRRGVLRWLAVIGFLSFPLAIILGPWGWRFDLPHFRVMLIVIFSLLAGISLPETIGSWPVRVVLMTLISATLLVLLQRYGLITDYPFSIGWSEGNRIWDYSLYFRRDSYDVTGEFEYPTYLTPGRHGLWGLPFLFFTNPTILGMRIWDTVLWTIPYLLLGIALFTSRRRPLPAVWRWILILWTFLFLYQGPIYAPLILSAAILAAGYKRQRIWQSIIVTALACFYAGISRWTWMVAPAAWAALWAFLEEDTKQRLWQRIRRPFILAVSGMVGAGLALLYMDLAFPRPDPIYSTALNQPLLWYRLWSSPTNPTGVLPGLLNAVGPLLIWMILMVATRRVKWDLLQDFSALGILLAFLGVGLVASVKIGGGSNIHNLDMFLVTLVLLVGSFVQKKGTFQNTPFYAWAVAAVVLFLPVWNLTQVRPQLDYSTDHDPQETLSQLRTLISNAAEEGEVLFIDQRQLLTFEEITDVPLVMEYELKNMMNQAMGHNQAYFESFRSDLAHHRFRLIVSDPLYVVFQGQKIAFGEENDAWVEEVTIPILEYYEPVWKFEDDAIWLLAPKGQTGG